MDGMTAGPGPGHNKSPDLASMLDPAILQDQIKLDHEELFQRADRLIAGAENYHDKFPSGPGNDEEAGKAGDFVKQIKGHAKKAEETHQAVKKPFLEAGRTVDALLKQGVHARLIAAAEKIERKVTAYLQAKAAAERKRAQEEADRKAAEAAKLAAAAEAETNDQRAGALMERAVEAAETSESAERLASSSVQDLSRTRGAFGSVSSLRDNWKYEVVDIVELARAVAAGQVPANYLQVNDAVVGGIVRPKTGIREIPGLRIFNEQRAGIR